MNRWLALVLWIGVSFLPSLTGFVARPGSWYQALDKPSWTPPPWIFGPVWTTLYLLMGIAAWLVWLRGGFGARGAALGLFLAQLALNALWTPLFFGWHRLGWAAFEIGLLWILIALTIAAFWRVRPAAGALLVPYLVWVSYAAALNVAIWQRNAG